MCIKSETKHAKKAIEAQQLPVHDGMQWNLLFNPPYCQPNENVTRHSGEATVRFSTLWSYTCNIQFHTSILRSKTYVRLKALSFIKLLRTAILEHTVYTLLPRFKAVSNSNPWTHCLYISESFSTHTNSWESWDCIRRPSFTVNCTVYCINNNIYIYKQSFLFSNVQEKGENDSQQLPMV